MEKAILANFSDANRLIGAYKTAKKALEKARRELEKTTEELRDIDPEKARLLAQLDSGAAAVLEELGILR
jgi:ABC-type transporter Mla subunit MlaD